MSHSENLEFERIEVIRTFLDIQNVLHLLAFSNPPHPKEKELKIATDQLQDRLIAMFERLERDHPSD